jgi:EAL domain-containing protein (putative c-di-GMP-specific phosphodiesterase class I)
MRSLHESRRRVQQGLEAGELQLYYQPKLELATNKVAGVEALIRWNHPEHGLLSPAAFLPALESSEMEIALGNWVTDTALTQLHEWRKAGVDLQVSINISARHLQSPDFVSGLESRLAQYPEFVHGSLQIEVLETAALEDLAHSSAVIETCRELGVCFALDDFGTGYSSLVYMGRLGADTLKIDRSFVKNMATSTGDRAIVQGVIALARTFGRQTVAEGVEDAALNELLKEMGCDYVQGYAIARPMAARELLAWYRKR